MKVKLLKKLRAKADNHIMYTSESNETAFHWYFSADYWYPDTDLKLHLFASSTFPESADELNKQIDELKRKYILLLLNKRRT